jgi:hypothetical protein
VERVEIDALLSGVLSHEANRRERVKNLHISYEAISNKMPRVVQDMMIAAF